MRGVDYTRFRKPLMALAGMMAVVSFCAIPALAEIPIPVITGPSGGVPGDLLILDASESQASHFAWTVIPQLPDGRQTMLVVENGRKAIVASVPGQYTVILAVSTDEGIAIKRHVVTVSGTTPRPEPQPGPRPDPIEPDPDRLPDVFGLASKVRGWAGQVQDKSRKSQLSRAFAAAADQATRVSDLKKIAGESRSNLSARLVADAIGGRQNASNWAPLFGPMGDELGRLAADGRLTTLADYQQAWREISEGLK